MSQKEHPLLQEFANKKISRDKLNSKVVDEFDLVPELICGMSHKKANVRYGCAKIINDLSAQYPEKIYPYIGEFFTLLDSEFRIIRWNAIAIIANLASVDKENKLDANFKKFYGLINDPYMVTVANLAVASGKIGQAKPYLIPKITFELLKIPDLSITEHLTEECRRVIAEKAIQSFSTFFDKAPADDQKLIVTFVNGCKNSTRKTLAVRAEKFLKQRAH